MPGSMLLMENKNKYDNLVKYNIAEESIQRLE